MMNYNDQSKQITIKNNIINTKLTGITNFLNFYAKDSNQSELDLISQVAKLKKKHLELKALLAKYEDR